MKSLYKVRKLSKQNTMAYPAVGPVGVSAWRVPLSRSLNLFIAHVKEHITSELNLRTLLFSDSC